MVSYLCEALASTLDYSIIKRHAFVDRILTEGDIEEKINSDSNLLNGIENEPIRSLYELSSGLTTIFGDNFMQSVIEAVRLSRNPLDRLTIDESAAICLYTMDTPLYSQLNKHLRNHDRKELKHLFPYLKLFFTAIFKLPWCTSDQLLWRGVNRDLSDQMKENDSIIWWQISSCSKQVQVAGTFGGFSTKYSPTCSTRSIITIQTSLAKNITNHSFYKEEQEFILLPGTILEVNNIAKDSSTTIYHLRDCNPPKQLLIDLFQNTNQVALPTSPTKFWSEEQLKTFLDQDHNPDEWIYLQDHTISEADLCILANQYELGKIHWPKLSLWNNSFDYRCAPHISAILKTNYLVCFNIGTNNLGVKGAVCLESLQYCDKLYELSLWNNQFGDEGLRYLISVVKKTNLKILNLGVNNITDAGLKDLLPELPSTIEDLDLFANQITNQSQNIICDAFRSRENLKIFILNGTNPIWQVREHRKLLANAADEYNRQLER